MEHLMEYLKKIPVWLIAFCTLVFTSIVLEQLYYSKRPVDIWGFKLNQAIQLTQEEFKEKKAEKLKITSLEIDVSELKYKLSNLDINTINDKMKKLDKKIASLETKRHTVDVVGVHKSYLVRCYNKVISSQSKTFCELVYIYKGIGTNSIQFNASPKNKRKNSSTLIADKVTLEASSMTIYNTVNARECHFKYFEFCLMQNNIPYFIKIEFLKDNAKITNVSMLRIVILIDKKRQDIEFTTIPISN